MAVKKTQMYRRNLDGTETNLNPLTESQYVLMENGQTVQEILSDRDSDKYTTVITNSSSTFKVGQGDNVDLSSSMKEGAYDSCVLKGKTMVNCIQEPSSKNIVLPYEFEEGQHVTINDTKESGALGVELKGQTLVNLFNTKDIVGLNGEMTIEKGVITLPIKNHRYNNFNIPKSKCTMFKPSTKYTMWVNMLENRSEDNEGETQQSGSFWLQTYDYSSSIVKTSNQGTYGCRFENNEVGVKTCVFETHAQNEYDSKSGGLNFDLPCYYAKNGGIQRVSIVIMEGDWSNQELPFDKFFTGMTSCKMPSLSTVGKNLFNINGYSTKNQYASINGNTITVNAPTTFSNTVYTLTGLKEGELYRVSLDKTGAGEFSIRDTNASSLLYVEKEEGHVSRTFRYEKGATIRIGNRQIVNSEVSFANIQIEHGSTETAHESYKSSILSLPEEVVLRSLPNGVCDTFNTRTCVYTQRIGEVVLNGPMGISGGGSYETDTHNTYIKSITNAIGGYNIYCDKIPVGKSPYNTESIEALAINSAGNQIAVRVAKSRFSSYSSFNGYLESNPIIFQYELATPIVTKINLPSALKSWNTATHIYSEIPENTLYPILSHSNPTYPVILKPSTKYSIVANSYSNSHTNSAINFNLGGATASTVVGNHVTTITTPSTLTSEELVMSGRGNKLSNVMVIEGDVVGDEPYFEGICDCKSPILSNVGKNLFDSSVEIVTGYGINSDSGAEYGQSLHSCTGFLRMKPNTTYTIAQNHSDSWAFAYDSDKKYIGLIRANIKNGSNFTTPSNTHYIRLDFLSVDILEITNGVCIEENTDSTAYEPYKSNTTTFEQKDDKTIVLRSLPNGVCDTLNVETGEYVQRIGEVVFDGSNDEGWFIHSENGFVNLRFRTTILSGKMVKHHYTTVDMNSDKMACYPNSEWSIDREGMERDSVYLSIRKNIETLDGFKQWLSQSPITVQYPLATPIVSTIDVQGFPYAYTNGHVQLSSGHSGQSLTPKVEYSLSANKTGQINSNTKRVSAHQKQLDDFEAMMLTSMVQSAYDKAILQFDYEMQMMSLGGE